MFVWVRVVGLFVSFGLINPSQALIITCIASDLDCSGSIFYLIYCSIGHHICGVVATPGV
jgi:hypothetical protein